MDEKMMDDPITKAVADYIAMEADAAKWRALMTELRAEITAGTPISPTLFHIIKTKAEAINAQS
jgi:hypothetical protein